MEEQKLYLILKIQLRASPYHHAKLAKKIEKEKSTGEKLRKKLSKAVKKELE